MNPIRNINHLIHGLPYERIDMSKNIIKGRFWYASEWQTVICGRSVNRNVVTYHELKTTQWRRIVRYRYDRSINLWNARTVDRESILTNSIRVIYHHHDTVQ